MEYTDTLWAHLGGDPDTDVTTQSEVDEWMRRQLDEAEDSNLDLSPVDNEPLAETTWNSLARRAILRRTASGEPEWVEAARRVVASNAYEQVDGVTLDRFAAGVLVGLWENISDENKDRFGALSASNAIGVIARLPRQGSRKRASNGLTCPECGEPVEPNGSGMYKHENSLTGPCGIRIMDTAQRPDGTFTDEDDLADQHLSGDDWFQEASRRQAGAPTIMGKDDGLSAAPKEEQDAYWTYVSQGAADSDSGWYVPLSFSSWRSSYWDDTKGNTTYSPGMPPMASSRQGSRKQASILADVGSMKSGDKLIFGAEGCYAQVWYDGFDAIGDDNYPTGDQGGEWEVVLKDTPDLVGGRQLAGIRRFRFVEPKMKGWQASATADYIISKLYDLSRRGSKVAADDADLYDPVGNRATDGGDDHDDEYEVTGNADTTTGDEAEEELYDDWSHGDDNGYDPMVDDPDRWQWQSGQTGLSVSANKEQR
jgi:hypothetical protein